ncbi:RNA transcription, translation and transport factor protein [Aplysia californica]|uniref:RNA transcription, translation and transport factor protein n=1 Tax=Aplysia californica TaxID=6500 RepID=A0ABM1A256_APLCA|nr:RNA transcription, translation and transport factor protein [Aplysia californica]
MFTRKLHSLDYPNPEKVDISDESCFRSMILWLEDQKIRHYKIEDRAALRNIQDGNWDNIAQNFLSQISCPYGLDDKPALLDWLLGYAVRLEYGDDTEKFKKITPEKFQQRKAVKVGESTNPLDALDFEDAEFKAGVTSLAMLLQVPPHPDHLEQLKAICILLKEKFSTEVLEGAIKNTDAKDEHIPLDRTELGFEAGDYIMTEAAKILRLLHIRDLRDLQNKINAAIVAVQAITANPKTDSRLGKVGR